MDWVQVSDEIWSQIFSVLLDDIDVNTAMYFEEKEANIQRFYDLRSVCSGFDTIFARRPELYSTLNLASGLKGYQLPTAFRWINQHCGSIKAVNALCGSSCLEAALAVLLTSKQQPSLASICTDHM